MKTLSTSLLTTSGNIIRHMFNPLSANVEYTSYGDVTCRGFSTS